LGSRRCVDGRGHCQGRLADDPDAAPIDIDWSDAVFGDTRQKKKRSLFASMKTCSTISKAKAMAYQRRINAVLRSYMQQKAKPKKRA